MEDKKDLKPLLLVGAVDELVSTFGLVHGQLIRAHECIATLEDIGLHLTSCNDKLTELLSGRQIPASDLVVDLLCDMSAEEAKLETLKKKLNDTKKLLDPQVKDPFYGQSVVKKVMVVKREVIDDKSAIKKIKLEVDDKKRVKLELMTVKKDEEEWRQTKDLKQEEKRPEVTLQELKDRLQSIKDNKIKDRRVSQGNSQDNQNDHNRQPTTAETTNKAHISNQTNQPTSQRKSGASKRGRRKASVDCCAKQTTTSGGSAIERILSLVKGEEARSGNDNAHRLNDSRSSTGSQACEQVSFAQQICNKPRRGRPPKKKFVCATNETRDQRVSQESQTVDIIELDD